MFINEVCDQVDPLFVDKNIPLKAVPAKIYAPFAARALTKLVSFDYRKEVSVPVSEEAKKIIEEFEKRGITA